MTAGPSIPYRALRSAMARKQMRVQRMGRLGGIAAPCACGCAGARRGIGRIGNLGPISTGAFSAQLEAQIKTQSSSVQQTLAAQTGVDTTDAHVAQGAQSAATLVQNGYNPNSSGDNQNLIHAIAGGLALIPGAGPLLAGAVEGLWLIGSQIACPVTNAFASVGLGTPCGAPPCKTSGNWTPAGLLSSNARELPATPAGSFASLAVPALATYAAQAGNCKGGMPPDVVVDAVVAIWNKTHAGPAASYFVPPIATLSGSITADLLGIQNQTSGSTPAARAGKDPNVYYAFGPIAAILKDGYYQSNPPKNVNAAQPWAAFAVPSAPAGMAFTQPRIVMVNTGALLPPPPPAPKKSLAFHLAPPPAKKSLALHLAPPSSTAAKVAAPAKPMSTGGKVAAVAAAGGGAALVWWLSSHGWKWVTPRFARGLVR
jgi:hypothetical protein